eukprot:jgi/Ulvmu1/11636/UM008_0040.1
MTMASTTYDNLAQSDSADSLDEHRSILNAFRWEQQSACPGYDGPCPQSACASTAPPNAATSAPVYNSESLRITGNARSANRRRTHADVLNVLKQIEAQLNAECGRDERSPIANDLPVKAISSQLLDNISNTVEQLTKEIRRASRFSGCAQKERHRTAQQKHALSKRHAKHHAENQPYIVSRTNRCPNSNGAYQAAPEPPARDELRTRHVKNPDAHGLRSAYDERLRQRRLRRQQRASAMHASLQAILSSPAPYPDRSSCAKVAACPTRKPDYASSVAETSAENDPESSTSAPPPELILHCVPHTAGVGPAAAPRTEDNGAGGAGQPACGPLLTDVRTTPPRSHAGPMPASVPPACNPGLRWADGAGAAQERLQPQAGGMAAPVTSVAAQCATATSVSIAAGGGAGACESSAEAAHLADDGAGRAQEAGADRAEAEPTQHAQHAACRGVQGQLVDEPGIAAAVRCDSDSDEQRQCTGPAAADTVQGEWGPAAPTPAPVTGHSPSARPSTPATTATTSSHSRAAAAHEPTCDAQSHATQKVMHMHSTECLMHSEHSMHSEQHSVPGYKAGLSRDSSCLGKPLLGALPGALSALPALAHSMLPGAGAGTVAHTQAQKELRGRARRIRARTARLETHMAWLCKNGTDGQSTSLVDVDASAHGGKDRLDGMRLVNDADSRADVLGLKQHLHDMHGYQRWLHFQDAMFSRAAAVVSRFGDLPGMSQMRNDHVTEG